MTLQDSSASWVAMELNFLRHKYYSALVVASICDIINIINSDIDL